MSTNIFAVRRLHVMVAAAVMGASAALGFATPADAETPGHLTVWFDGWGAGSVTSSPAGINCSQTRYNWETGEGGQVTGTCDAAFPNGHPSL